MFVAIDGRIRQIGDDELFFVAVDRRTPVRHYLQTLVRTSQQLESDITILARRVVRWPSLEWPGRL
jgi:hypothetical protein